MKTFLSVFYLFVSISHLNPESSGDYCESPLVNVIEEDSLNPKEIDYLIEYSKTNTEHEIKRPTIKFILNENIYDYQDGIIYDFKGNEERHLKRLVAIESVYYEHMRQLLSIGVNVDLIEDFQIVLNGDNETIATGGYYVYHGLHKAPEKYNFDKNTIVLYYPTNLSMFQLNLYNTYIHEFGHHVGFSKLHKDKEFDVYKNIRNNKEYYEDKDYFWYPVEWRNNIYEQFAETYMELFIKNYDNVSSAPSLSDEQKEKMVEFISTEYGRWDNLNVSDFKRFILIISFISILSLLFFVYVYFESEKNILKEEELIADNIEKMTVEEIKDDLSEKGIYESISMKSNVTIYDKKSFAKYSLEVKENKVDVYYGKKLKSEIVIQN